MEYLKAICCKNLVRAINILEDIILVGHPLNVEGRIPVATAREVRILKYFRETDARSTATLGIVLDKALPGSNL
jgi:hypothetical protein